MKWLDNTLLTLAIIGCVVWGLIGFFGYDVVTSIFGGSMFWISRVIFGLVGLAGLWSLTFYNSLAQESPEVRIARH